MTRDAIAAEETAMQLTKHDFANPDDAMKRRNRIRGPVLAAMTMLVSVQVWAAPLNERSAPVAAYSVQAQVTGPGGSPMTGASGLSLDGTVGDVDSPTMTGANGFSLASGFWPVVAQLTGDKIFANGFETP